MEIIVYFTLVRSEIGPEDDDLIAIIMVFNAIDIILGGSGTILMLSAMITIPCHWIKRMLDSIQVYSQTIVSAEDSQKDELKERVFIDRCFRTLKALRVYRMARMVQFLVILITSICVLWAGSGVAKAMLQT